MRTTRICALSLAWALPLIAHAQWDPAGGDHAGEDWTLEDGAVLSGVHTNIGRMRVPEGVTVRVAPHVDGVGGSLEIHACSLELLGHLDGGGAGHAGAVGAAAQGGHRGDGPGGGCGGGPGSCVGQGGTGGSYGGVGGTAESDSQWAQGNACVQCDNPAESHCYGVAGEVQGVADGGEIAMGSGGGAGGNSCGCNGAGGPGGAGGAAVKLMIREEARVEGSVQVDGVTPPVDASDCGYHPGGGGGSGGGVLLQAASFSGRGVLQARGGGGGESDGCPSACGSWAWAGGGGSGGRIKTYSPDDTFEGTLSVEGGAGGPAPAGNNSLSGRGGGVGTVTRGQALVVDLVPCAGPPRMRIEHGLTFGEAEEVTLRVSGRDPDGGEVRYDWDLDGDGDFDDAHGEEAVTTYPDDGDYPVALRGVDDEDEEAVLEFVVHVENRPPTLASEPPTEALELVPYQYVVDASDPAGLRDPLSAELTQGPVGMAVEGMTLSWTPTLEQALEGLFAVSLRVTDDDGGSVTQAWRVEVTWLDEDGDGMSDGWERAYGLDPDDPSDADDDPDGDGLSNLEEFEAGRDPTRSGIPDRPEALSPEDGAWVVTATPELVVANAFDPDGDALTYSFEVADGADFEAPHLAEAGVVEGAEGRTGWLVRLPLAEGETYWWRARASDGPFHSAWSDPRSLIVNSFPEPPGRPEQLRPRDAAPVATPTPELVVGAVFDPDGDPVEIHFEVFADEAAMDLTRRIVAPQGRADAEVFGTPAPPLEEDTTYWWRAEAVDAAGLSSGPTGLWSLRVNSDNSPPPAPRLLRPSTGAQIADFTVLLAARVVEDPDGDPVALRVEVDTSEAFDSPAREIFEDLVPAMGDVVTVELAGRRDNALYHWRARAEDGLDVSPWVRRHFVVNFENEPPGAPRPRAPIDDQAVSPDGVTLTLDPAVDPDHDPLKYVFQVALDGEFRDVVAESEPLAGGGPGEPVGWRVEGLDDHTSYAWRALAVDPQRVRGPWSAPARFVTDSSPGGEGGDGGEGGEGSGTATGGGAEVEGGAGPGGGGADGAGGSSPGDAGPEPGGSRAGGCACRVGGGAGAGRSVGVWARSMLSAWGRR